MTGSSLTQGARGITALLGPTNTGKTHHAIERMLEHSSGMIGLPLRLLAREVYDRITARVGESRVALVTGEEQRVPRRPSYWVATVEAMPVGPAGPDVDFLAVDEIQLAAHAQRGHVFTSRLLSARGRLSTWFLGADTMRAVLRELVPTASPITHPRLSRLTYAGATPLARLPPRTAVVAFSMPHVYEIADKLRMRRGGAAVVLGALSPRTRNAQVAMFQSGEVDCVVATDAIGMGLNLDIEHVAFAATRKFDGQTSREVDEAELGQIAGRAGRYVHDGTFGTITPLDLPTGVARAIETHAFGPVRRVRWRSDDLDFTSIADLRASLAVAPTKGILRHASGAEDAAALALLASRDEVRRRATTPERVRLLWDVCTVPDFRKLLLEAHVDFLEQLYVELVDRGRARDEWIARHLRELSGKRAEDVEELIARIASIRVFTYVTNRSTWLESASEWQERTRELEDNASDALHERLVARFVDHKQKVKRHTSSRTRSDRSSPQLQDEGPTDASHPFAKLALLRGAVQPSSILSLPGSWIEEVIAAKHAELDLDASGAIAHDGRVLGRLVRGGSIALPDVRAEDSSGELGAGARSRLQRRLLAFARDVVFDLLGGVTALATKEAAAPLRGLVHRLEQGLGTALTSELEDVLAVLSPSDRSDLEARGVRFGAGVVYVESGTSSGAVERRVALATTWFRSGRGLVPPSSSSVSFTPSRAVSRQAFTTIGFPVVGPRAIRADILDRVLERITERGHDDEDEAMLASWIGASRAELRRILSETKSRD